jgi:RNA polymerase sigma factor (sigma-70 family)
MKDEADWIAALARGDERAAVRFDEQFRARLNSLARKRRLSAQDAEDIAQIVIADALQQLRRGAFRGESALSSWLYRIFENKIASHWRKAKPAPVPVSDGHQISPSSPSDVVLVRQILEQMDGLDRFVLVSHEGDGRTLEEIGALVGLKKSAVSARLKRARRYFRDAVRGGGGKLPRLKD